MRKNIAIFLCIFLLAVATAQCQQAPTDVPEVKRVTLELKDTPLKMAIERVVKFSSAEYKMDPALDELPYDRIVVSIRFVNVPYYEALGSLLSAHQLTVSVEDSVRIVKPVSAGGMVAAAMAGGPDLITMHIPKMPVAQALAYLSKDARQPVKWTFQGALGNAVMPGVSFFQFPINEAADVLLASAGLVPPTGADTVVKSRGVVDLSKVISYVPGGCLPLGYGMTRRSDVPVSVAVANFQTANSPQPLLIVLANQEQDIVVLDKVLTTSGVNYVLGDGSTPAEMKGPKLVSIRLYGVTLQQALKSILPPVNLRYRIEDLSTAPTMIIDAVPTK